jgi:glucose/arabinose dehydrogenase
VTVGSNSNVAENGIDKERGRAAIWEIDAGSGNHRIFASGLRNPNGMAWEPASRTLWTVANERDELGSDLVPDYLTSVRDGGFYGWPYSYYGQHVDERVKPARPDWWPPPRARLRAGAAHRLAGPGVLGGRGAGPALRPGDVRGQHGSWNRKPRSGYKVVFVPFAGGKPSGDAVDVLTGFLSDGGDAFGRPVGVVLDAKERCWSPTT